jgi:hypothetical protein
MQQAGGEQEQRKEHLRAGIQGLSARLRASLGASSPLADSLTKGEMREEELVDAFGPYVPKRYELIKGVVVNTSGAESDPQDVILFDTSLMPTFFGSGTNRIVPVEGVAGVIQVKSRATPKDIRSAVSNVASAKRLLSQQTRYGAPPATTDRNGTAGTAATFFGGALFLSKQGRDRSLLDAYAQAVMAVEPRERCDALCIVDEFAVLWGNPSHGEGLHFCWRGEQAEAPLRLLADEDSLLLFYLSLAENLANWISPPVRWMDYVFGSNTPGQTSLEFQYSYYTDKW